MNALAEKLAAEALTLPEDDRAALVDILLQSLRRVESQLDQLWANEAETRVQQIEQGEITLLDGEAVLQEVRNALRR